MSWPTLDQSAVVLPELDELGLSLWEIMIQLAQELPGQWTLIGGQMVLLHALENGVQPTRVSTDLDALVHFRAVAGALPKFVATLEKMGFKEDGISPDGLGHRYRRGDLSVDVLAPEGLGENADLRTRPPAPVRTLQVPGGTQALQRTELVPVKAGPLAGLIPRPSLLGAIVGKAVAVEVDDLPDAQRADLVLLLSLVEDPFELIDEMIAKDRKRLAGRQELFDRQHPAWRTLTPDAADRAHATLQLMATVPPA